ncbi:hypothetical protein GQ42DRAFT_163695 [Ramicandelaber brevisporus]|nr:hypothetical protein GQ42DRAFT_163695 [Ramicandelaber brevisporus]
MRSITVDHFRLVNLNSLLLKRYGKYVHEVYVADAKQLDPIWEWCPNLYGVDISITAEDQSSTDKQMAAVYKIAKSAAVRSGTLQRLELTFNQRTDCQMSGNHSECNHPPLPASTATAGVKGSGKVAANKIVPLVIPRKLLDSIGRVTSLRELVISIGCHVESGDMPCEQAWWALFRKLPNLTVLRPALGMCMMSPRYFNILAASCPNLTELLADIEVISSTDGAVNFAPAIFPNLRDIECVRCLSTLASDRSPILIHPLAMPNLIKMELSFIVCDEENCPLYYLFIDERFTWLKLTSMYIGEYDCVTDTIMDLLPLRFPHLTSLELTYCRRITVVGIANVLRGLTCLRSLWADLYNDNDDQFGELASPEINIERLPGHQSGAKSGQSSSHQQQQQQQQQIERYLPPPEQWGCANSLQVLSLKRVPLTPADVMAALRMPRLTDLRIATCPEHIMPSGFIYIPPIGQRFVSAITSFSLGTQDLDIPSLANLATIAPHLRMVTVKDNTFAAWLRTADRIDELRDQFPQILFMYE